MLVKWVACEKRSHVRIKVMENRGRGHGRPRRQEATEDMNELAKMMRTMMEIMDAIEAAHRRQWEIE